MSTVLVLNTSVSGEGSVSRALVQDALSLLKAGDPELRVIERDLAETPVPHLTTETVSSIRGPDATTPAQIAARALSDTLIRELKEADTILIGAPMYNFGITSTLKTWFDYVLRAGITFRYTEAGPEGLIKGKRAIVVMARGGLYSEGPAQVMDSQEPHLRTLLGFMGITDVTFVRAERLGFGSEIREQSIGQAQSELKRVHEGTFKRAA